MFIRNKNYSNGKNNINQNDNEDYLYKNENKESEIFDVLEKDAIITQMDQANELREKFAFWAMFYVSFFTITVIIIVWLCAISARSFFFINFNSNFNLDSNVIITLLCSFTAQIIGVVLAILIYLFPRDKL